MAGSVSNVSYGSASSPIGNIFYGQTPSVNVLSGYSKLSDSQLALLDSLSGYLSGAMTKDQSYGGKLTAGVNSVQTQSIADLMNYKSPTADLNSGVNSTLSGLLTTGGREELTKNYLENVEKPLINTYENVTMPHISTAFASKGLSYGTDKQTAINSASRTLMDALAKGRSQLESDILGKKLEAVTKTNETNAQSLSEVLGLTSPKTSAGKTMQDTEQLDLTNTYNQWLRNQVGSNPVLSMIMQLLGVDTMYDAKVVGSEDSKNASSTGGVLSSIIEAVL